MDERVGSAIDEASSQLMRLRADELLCVMAFLDWNDLIAAARTCIEWDRISAKERSRGLKLVCTTENEKRDSMLSKSSLRVHVSELEWSVDRCMTREDLGMLHCLPSLTSATFLIDCTMFDDATEPLDTSADAVMLVIPIFPNRLTDLLIDIVDGSRSTVQRIIDAVAAISGLASLTLVTVELSDAVMEQLDIEPLLHLEDLVKFTMESGSETSRLTVAQIDVIRCMHHLTKLGILCDHGFTADDMQRVFAKSHGFNRLRTVDLTSTVVSKAHYLALATVESLTSLVPGDHKNSPLEFLVLWPNLRELGLWTGFLDSPKPAVAQATLEHLTSLRLFRGRIADHSIFFLTRLTKIDTLELCGVILCDLFAFTLNAVPTLTKLIINQCIFPRMKKSPKLWPKQKLVKHLRVLHVHNTNLVAYAGDVREFMPNLIEYSDDYHSPKL